MLDHEDWLKTVAGVEAPAYHLRPKFGGRQASPCTAVALRDATTPGSPTSTAATEVIYAEDPIHILPRGTIRDPVFGVIEMMTQVRPAWPAEAIMPNAAAKFGQVQAKAPPPLCLRHLRRRARRQAPRRQGHHPANALPTSTRWKVRSPARLPRQSQGRRWVGPRRENRGRQTVLSEGWHARQQVARTPGLRRYTRDVHHRRPSTGRWTRPGVSQTPLTARTRLATSARSGHGRHPRLPSPCIHVQKFCAPHAWSCIGSPHPWFGGQRQGVRRRVPGQHGLPAPPDSEGGTGRAAHRPQP